MIASYTFYTYSPKDRVKLYTFILTYFFNTTVHIYLSVYVVKHFLKRVTADLRATYCAYLVKL